MGGHFGHEETMVVGTCRDRGACHQHFGYEQPSPGRGRQLRHRIEDDDGYDHASDGDRSQCNRCYEREPDGEFLGAQVSVVLVAIASSRLDTALVMGASVGFGFRRESRRSETGVTGEAGNA